MNTTDYIVNVSLVLIVLRQLKGGRLTAAGLLVPVLLIAATAFYYLRSIPTAGDDVVLEATLAGAGLVLGTLCGLATRVWRADGGIFVKAGPVAAALWIGGIGARMIFAYAADHGFGNAIGTFSRDHQITGASAWVAAFVLMALGEAVGRLLILQTRRFTARSATSAAMYAA